MGKMWIIKKVDLRENILQWNWSHHKLKIYNGLERQYMYLLPLAAVLQDTRGVIDGPVVFADREVGALMLVHLDH